MPLPKVIAVLGPTASGKTNVALQLARRFSGEILLADSRQLYVGMDIGTNKESGEWRHGIHHVSDIPYYGVDLIEPTETFTVHRWKAYAQDTVSGILSRKHLPIIEGGTGLYVSALLDNLTIPEIPPQKELRRQIEKRIEKEGVATIAAEVLKIDPAAETFLDAQNPRRVTRAMEIIMATGKLPSQQRGHDPKLYNDLRVGIQRPLEELDARIEERVAEWLLAGALEKEVKRLSEELGWDAPPMETAGYSAWQGFFLGKKPKEDVGKDIIRAHKQIARAQIKWLKRDDSIHWITSADEAEALVTLFLNK